MTKAIALLALLFLVVPSRADDQEAADLFYRAFWLEQAEGKAEEAGALYDRVWKQFPDSPEAPRALLGLVRLRVASGVDAAELVELMARRCPDAGAELEQARALVSGGAAGEAFDKVEWLNSGSPLKQKLAAMYDYLDAPDALDEPDFRFLVEAGAAAHPMLHAALNGLNYEAVRQAAIVLLRQGHPRSVPMLREALAREGMPFRYAIVEALSDSRIDDRGLIEAVIALYDEGSLEVRKEVLWALAIQIEKGSTAGDAIWPLLTRALGSEKDDLRRTAAGVDPVVVRRAPPEYVRKLLALMMSDDSALPPESFGALPMLAGIEEYRAAVLEVLQDRFPVMPGVSEDEISGSAWTVLMEAALRYLNDHPTKRDAMGPAWVLRSAAARSRKALGRLLVAAVEGNEPRYEKLARDSVAALDSAGRAARLGDEVTGVLRHAVDTLLHTSGGEVARTVLQEWVGVIDETRVVWEALQRDPAAPLSATFVETLGQAFQHEEMFRRLLKQLSPEHARAVDDILRASPHLATPLIERLLDLRGEEWGWTGPNAEGGHARPWGVRRNRKESGPGLWRIAIAQLADVPPPASVPEHTDDDRYEIAETALGAALGAGDAMALHRALASPFERIRVKAIERIEDAPALAEYLLGDLAPLAELAALRRLAKVGTPAQADVAARLVEAGGDNLVEAWRCWLALSPEAAVAAAVRSAVYHEDGGRVAAALDVLTRSDDRRRIEVFRNVLAHGKAGDVLTVVKTIGEQYVVELGAEVVEQLRNPDPKVRNAATTAIERLKFYAEARKAFAD